MVAIAFPHLPPTTATPAPARSTRPGGSPVRLVADLDGRDVDLDGRRAMGRSWRALLATVVLCASLLAAVGFLASLDPIGADAVATQGTHAVVEGESMWSIAQDLAPAGEGASYAERLAEVNGGTTVVPGQVLILPAG